MQQVETSETNSPLLLLLLLIMMMMMQLLMVAVNRDARYREMPTV